MKNKLKSLIIGVALAATITSQAQTTNVPSLLPPLSLSQIAGAPGAALQQVGTDAVSVFKTFSLTNPISGGLVFLKNGSLPGFGLDVTSVNPGSSLNVGFGMFAIQQINSSGNKEWGFYDATLNLSVSTVETVPILNIPLVMKIESGPAVRLSSGGNTLLEQSAAFGDVTFEFVKTWPMTFGAGIIHCSAFSGVLPMFHFNVTHTF